MTPREYEALKAIHEGHTLKTAAMYAALQATLHNANFKHPDGESARWSMEDFMEGGRKPQSGEDKAAMFGAMMEQTKVALEMRKRMQSPKQSEIPQAVRDRVAARRT
jgi:hypothetical protein